MVANVENVYEGNLIKYFQILFHEASNKFHPYHNMRHMLHVAWECYHGARFYKMEPRAFRNLLIAALFHDFNHSGQMVGSDDLEIERSLRALRKHILPEDAPFLEVIERDIRATQFPHIVSVAEMSQSAMILRDSDMSQGFATAWIQQILFGLSIEMRVTPKELLVMQKSFLSEVKFSTSWAKEKYDCLRKQRIEEVEAMLEILAV